MKSFPKIIAAVAAFLVCSPLAAFSQQASTVKVISVPATVRVNTNVTLKGSIHDAWNNAPLLGRLVSIEVGERYYVTSAAFTSGSAGVFSRTWRFMTPGRYRVSFKYYGDGTFSDSRVTTFINVTR